MTRVERTENMEDMGHKEYQDKMDNTKMDNADMESDVDSDFDDDIPASFRERRLQELREIAEKQRKLELERHGSYDTIRSEKEVLAITTSTEKCLVHFSHKDFRRCQLMDTHMAVLARKHPSTRFIKIDVDNAPFLVDRLKIQILPCLAAFVNSVSVDRLLGFEGVADKDDFETSALEKRLAEGSKVIEIASKQPVKRSILGFVGKSKAANDSDEDEEDDDDY